MQCGHKQDDQSLVSHFFLKCEYQCSFKAVLKHKFLSRHSHISIWVCNQMIYPRHVRQNKIMVQSLLWCQWLTKFYVWSGNFSRQTYRHTCINIEVCSRSLTQIERKEYWNDNLCTDRQWLTLRSRCTMLLSWRKAKPSKICARIRRTSSSLKDSLMTHSWNSSPPEQLRNSKMEINSPDYYYILT